MKRYSGWCTFLAVNFILAQPILLHRTHMDETQYLQKKERFSHFCLINPLVTGSLFVRMFSSYSYQSTNYHAPNRANVAQDGFTTPSIADT